MQLRPPQNQALKNVKSAFIAGLRRLVVVAATGVGKTRLGLQLAAEVLDAFVDGAWLVELESLTEGSLVPQEVAMALGVAKESDADAMHALIRPSQFVSTIVTGLPQSRSISSALPYIGFDENTCPRINR